MKKIICLVIAMMMVSTQVFAATYYDVNVEGLTYSEKEDLVEWLEDEDMEYDVESYTSSSSSTKTKELEVEKLSNSQKNTLVNWLESRDYDYSTKTKKGYYYVTVEYNSSTKSTLINYLENKNYDYDNSNSSNSSSDRTGNAYLVANGTLWYADGSDIEKVDDIYSSEYVLFTKDGGLAYINDSKNGMHIEDMDDPTESNQIVKSAKRIKTNSSGYAISFNVSNIKTTEIETEEDFDNDEVTVYIVKNNTLYSLSPKNKLTKLKSLKYVSTSSSYSKNNTNIGFSEWGDLVFIDSSGVCFFNEEIDDTDEIQTLKDQNNRTVQAKYFTVSNGVVKTVILSNGSSVRLEDD